MSYLVNEEEKFASRGVKFSVFSRSFQFYNLSVEQFNRRHKTKCFLCVYCGSVLRI